MRCETTGEVEGRVGVVWGGGDGAKAPGEREDLCFCQIIQSCALAISGIEKKKNGGVGWMEGDRSLCVCLCVCNCLYLCVRACMSPCLCVLEGGEVTHLPSLRNTY